ncbi:MAG: hypothetical protein ACREDA_09115 [Methylocella sp.]
MSDGLTAEQAATAAGAARATLCRWNERVLPRRRRPHFMRKPWRPRGLVPAVERLRLDHPVWGKLKLGPVLRKQGFAVSGACGGRFAGELIRRGVVAKVPALIRKAAARPAPKKRPHAIRKPKQLTFENPGGGVQIDTLSVSPAQGCSINGPSRDLPDRPPPKELPASSTRSSAKCRTPSKP